MAIRIELKSAYKSMMEDGFAKVEAKTYKSLIDEFFSISGFTDSALRGISALQREKPEDKDMLINELYTVTKALKGLLDATLLMWLKTISLLGKKEEWGFDEHDFLDLKELERKLKEEGAKDGNKPADNCK